jgi:hypothetical protein
VSALDRLIGARLSARELDAAGVRFDPLLSMRLAAVMIDPAWTAGSRFVIGHRESSSAPPGAYLHVRDGKRPLAAGEPPHGPVDTLLSCPGEALFAVLAGAAAPSEVAGGEIVGEERPLTLLARWLERAQCG